jgi:hypothetical protein
MTAENTRSEPVREFWHGTRYAAPEALTCLQPFALTVTGPIWAQRPGAELRCPRWTVGTSAQNLRQAPLGDRLSSWSHSIG